MIRKAVRHLRSLLCLFERFLLHSRSFALIVELCFVTIVASCTAGNVSSTDPTKTTASDVTATSPNQQKLKMHPALDPNQCVAAVDAKTSLANSVVLSACGSGVEQEWTFQNAHLFSSGKECLGTVATSSAAGTRLRVSACNSADNSQNWRLSESQIRLINTTACLGLSAAASQPNSELQLRSCVPLQDANTSWTLEALTDDSANAASQMPNTIPGLPNFSCPGLPDWTAQAQEFEATVFKEINAARALGADCHTAGVKPPRGALKLDQRLVCIARGFAKTMSDKNFFSHVSPDGKGPFDRMSQAGVKWRTGAENIALGPQDASSVVKGWLGSDGHCADLMGDYALTGIGYFNSYWVQDFATEF